MAISCDPNDLLAASKCMKCIPVGAQNEVVIYLLQQIAGNTMTPQQLMDAARCYKCIPAGMQAEVQTFLLCNVACVLPLAPVNLHAVPADPSVTLTWTASAGATGYIVKRSSISGGPYTTIATVAGSSYVDLAMPYPNITSYYVVSATNACGESGNSIESGATPGGVT